MRYPTRSLLSVLALACTMVHAEELPEPIHQFEEALVIGGVRNGGRRPVRSDVIESQLVQGSFEGPTEGDAVENPRGMTRNWRRMEAGANGWMTSSVLRGGYAYCTYEADEPGTVLLDARGHSMVYVNGVPRVGDPYRYGATVLPVELRKGTNEFLFFCGRGGFKGSIRPLPEDESGAGMETFFLERDDTLPDVLRGRSEDLWLGIVVVNAAAEPRTVELTGHREGVRSSVGTVTLPARSLSKVPVRIPSSLLVPEDERDEVELELEAGEDRRRVRLRVRDQDQKHRVTFQSGIDDGVQYYAVVPPRESEGDPGLILSLHGASVEAQRQAACYRPTDFAVIVAPTNRRPFGFDWEDWGRWDALEVMDHARERFSTDPRRQWLTGHSMGGHGTWHIGAMFPDRFAAIAPSAGWPSFQSYTGARADEMVERHGVEDVMMRSAGSSDTLRFKSNYAPLGVFILHGDVDDNVPVGQARLMRRELGTFHPDFTYQEIPGAGHWWGDQCMDWPPLIEFLRARTLPAPRDRDTIDFTTPGPGISPSFDWVTVVQQERSMEPSRVRIQRDLDAGTITGTTENVRILELDLGAFGGAEDDRVLIELDGSTVQVLGDVVGRRSLPLQRAGDGTWSREATGNRDASRGPAKNPERSGPFKDAFRRRMVFVVGTAGTEEETNLLRNLARFNAEQWWYRGNGSVEIVDDQLLVDRPDSVGDRNVILFGNSDTNRAWPLLVDDAVDVDRGGVTIGDHRVEGGDLAVLMVRPHPRDPGTSVGIVTGTGMTGNRLAGVQPYWVSGVGYPDLTVLGAEMLRGDGDGVRAAGFFGNDWSIREGELVIPGPEAER